MGQALCCSLHELPLIYCIMNPSPILVMMLCIMWTDHTAHTETLRHSFDSSDSKQLEAVFVSITL